jgi:hypothetical protein
MSGRIYEKEETMAKYRKRPVVIDAVRLKNKVLVHTDEGEMIGEPGDWLITGVNGEQYPCKDDVFRKTYEAVAEPVSIPQIPQLPTMPAWSPTRLGEVIC